MDFTNGVLSNLLQIALVATGFYLIVFRILPAVQPLKNERNIMTWILALLKMMLLPEGD